MLININKAYELSLYHHLKQYLTKYLDYIIIVNSVDFIFQIIFIQKYNCILITTEYYSQTLLSIFKLIYKGVEILSH